MIRSLAVVVFIGVAGAVHAQSGPAQQPGGGAQALPRLGGDVDGAIPPRRTPAERVERPPTGAIVIDRQGAADGRARPSIDRCATLPANERALCLDKQDPHRAGELLRDPTQSAR